MRKMHENISLGLGFDDSSMTVGQVILGWVTNLIILFWFEIFSYTGYEATFFFFLKNTAFWLM